MGCPDANDHGHVLSRVGDMPNPRTGGHSCGLVQDPLRGPEVVVVGGMYYEAYLDDVDIYTVDTDTWREGAIHFTFDYRYRKV